ncbi:hypothetical protein [Sphaerisporangium sp. NPDC051011]|uniref:hypothetical protein n=1 Tax=Sphaerisporangium sp. NPDC051011 TaxID=3155792 RepID=UPI0033C27644
MLSTDQRIDIYLQQNGGGSRLTPRQYRRIFHKENGQKLEALGARQAKADHTTKHRARK